MDLPHKRPTRIVMDRRRPRLGRLRFSISQTWRLPLWNPKPPRFCWFFFYSRRRCLLSSTISCREAKAMLNLARRAGQKVVIRDRYTGQRICEVEVAEFRTRSIVVLGFDAPDRFTINREEVDGRENPRAEFDDVDDVLQQSPRLPDED